MKFSSFSPAAKKLLNSLRCPVCKSQIDIMTDSERKLFSSHWNCRCAQSPHFLLELLDDDLGTKIFEEKLSLLDQKNSMHWELTKMVENSIIPQFAVFHIVAWEVDGDGNIIETSHPKFFKILKEEIFDFRNFDPKEALKRLRTIMTFQ